MKRTTTVMVTVPAAVVLVASGVGVASAFDQPHPTTTRPASSTAHDPTPAHVTATRTLTTGTQHASTIRPTSTVRQTRTDRPHATVAPTSTSRATTTQPARSYTYSRDCDRDQHGSCDHDGMHDGTYGGMGSGGGWHH